MAIRPVPVIGALLGLALIAPPVQATDPSPTILEQQRTEQQRIDEEAARRLRALPETVTPPVAPGETVQLLPEGRCQTIRKFWLYGADILPEAVRARLLAPYRNRCLNNTELNRLVRDIQRWYLDNGYITSRARLKSPQDSLERGNLEIWVFEGRIAEIRTRRDSPFDRRRIRSAFPTQPGDVLDIHALDQGLEQLNRLFSQRFRMRIEPADRPGYSRILLTETAGGRRRLRYQLTNSGIEATGEHLQQIEFTRENLLGYNDSLTAFIQRGIPYDPDARASQSLRAAFSMPWGYGFYQASHYRGETTRTIQGANATFLSKSRIRTTRVSTNQVFQRSQRFKREWTGGIEFNQRRNYINDTLVGISSRDTASVDFGLVETRYFPKSTLILSPSLVRGVPWFGALSDRNRADTASPSAEYALARLYAYFNHFLSWPRPSPLSYQAALTAQYSNNPLYGEKQIVVGGEYSVRGFKDDVVAGDDGGYLRNDLVLPLRYWVRDSVFAPLSARVFLDMGLARDKATGARFHLAGGGLGLDYRRNGFRFHVYAAHPLAGSESFRYRNEWTTYAGLTFDAVF